MPTPLRRVYRLEPEVITVMPNDAVRFDAVSSRNSAPAKKDAEEETPAIAYVLLGALGVGLLALALKK